MKANWSCTECGMYSGRRYCVQRHIDNIHKGKAYAIPFVEYLVGRRDGLYPPNVRPSYGSQKQRTLLEKTEDELENTYARRAAESYIPALRHPVYRPLVNAAVNNIIARKSHTDWGEFLQICGLSRNNSKQDVLVTQGTISKAATQDNLFDNADLSQKVDLTDCKKKLDDVLSQ
jgi:hypothetical protein